MGHLAYVGKEYLVNIPKLTTTHTIRDDWSLNPKDGDQFLYHQATPLVVEKK